jgi:hypothetical protein
MYWNTRYALPQEQMCCQMFLLLIEMTQSPRKLYHLDSMGCYMWHHCKTGEGDISVKAVDNDESAFLFHIFRSSFAIVVL